MATGNIGSVVVRNEQQRPRNAWPGWLLPAALVAYASAAVMGTHLPRLPQALSPAKNLVSDKLAHGIAYTGLTLLVIGVAVQSQRLRRLISASGRRRGVVVVAAGLLALYGLLDEATQPLVGRNFDWYDWAADLLGIATALAITAVAILGQSQFRPARRS